MTVVKLHAGTERGKVSSEPSAQSSPPSPLHKLCLTFYVPDNSLQGFGNLQTLEILLTCVGHHQYEVRPTNTSQLDTSQIMDDSTD